MLQNDAHKGRQARARRDKNLQFVAVAAARMFEREVPGYLRPEKDALAGLGAEKHMGERIGGGGVFFLNPADEKFIEALFVGRRRDRVRTQGRTFGVVQPENYILSGNEIFDRLGSRPDAEFGEGGREPLDLLDLGVVLERLWGGARWPRRPRKVIN